LVKKRSIVAFFDVAGGHFCASLEKKAAIRGHFKGLLGEFKLWLPLIKGFIPVEKAVDNRQK